MTQISLPPATSPLVDPSTGRIVQAWYAFCRQLLKRTGGTEFDLVESALHVTTNGVVVNTNSGAITRTITAGTGISVTNGDGVAGNPTIASTITQFTTEDAQDAVGAMVDGSLIYDDATPRLSRAALTGDVTASQGSNALTIANDAVTYAKMQNVSATSRVLGRKSASAGDTEELTLSDILDFIGSAAQGDILYRGSSSWERLGAGTAGQFLKTNGAGNNPTWASVSGTGGGAAWTQLDYYNFGSGASQTREVDVTGYGEVLVLCGALTNTSSIIRGIQCSTDGGSTWKTTSGDYLVLNANGAGSNNAFLQVSSGAASTASQGVIHFYNIDNTVNYKHVNAPTRGVTNVCQFTQAINRIRLMGNASATSGTPQGSYNGGDFQVFAR